MYSTNTSAAAVVFAVLLLQLVCLSWVQAQGHQAGVDVKLKRAPSGFKSLANIRRESINWRNAYRVSSTAAGKKQCAYLCSADLRGEEEFAIATMATAPQVYNTSAAHGRLHVVSAVANQECYICVAYAVVAAAETAAAVRLQRSLGSSRLSAEHFYFCGYPNITQAYQPTCRSQGLTVTKGAEALAVMLTRGQVPLTDDCFKYEYRGSVWDTRRDCKPRTPTCGSSQLTRLLQQGRVNYLGLPSVWQMQQHIRQFGSIVCPITVSPSLERAFNTTRAAVYNGPGAALCGMTCDAGLHSHEPVRHILWPTVCHLMVPGSRHCASTAGVVGCMPQPSPQLPSSLDSCSCGGWCGLVVDCGNNLLTFCWRRSPRRPCHLLLPRSAGGWL
jgi:hypothetical protein